MDCFDGVFVNLGLLTQFSRRIRIQHRQTVTIKQRMERLQGACSSRLPLLPVSCNHRLQCLEYPRHWLVPYSFFWGGTRLVARGFGGLHLENKMVRLSKWVILKQNSCCTICTNLDVFLLQELPSWQASPELTQIIKILLGLPNSELNRGSDLTPYFSQANT